jgi:hypothetical protein
MLSPDQINALTKDGDTTAEIILTLDALADKVTGLAAKVKTLEGQLKCLQVWAPGDNSWRTPAVGSEGRQEPGRDAST